jgi:hypothetical protein
MNPELDYLSISENPLFAGVALRLGVTPEEVAIVVISELFDAFMVTT